MDDPDLTRLFVNMLPKAATNPFPFMVGEVVPGYCGGKFSSDSYDQDLRVEAVGADWIVLRGERGEIHFYAGSHAELRMDATTTMNLRRERDKMREAIGGD